ncbi:MAG TPA: DUF3761 domain-containing protein [Gemmatimonadaceae bacterium]
MRTRILIPAIAAFLSVGVLRSPVGAQATTVCKDGTTSTTSGRGACSGHGGVDTKATSAAKKAEKSAKKAETTPKAEAKTEAKKAAEQVTCSDGTTSKAGRGACSGHGGVRPAGTPAATAAPAPPPPPAAAKSSAARTKAEPATKAATPTQPSSKRGEDNDPKDAIAQCKDGMYSHSANRRGACSRHGGVAKWLKEP